MKEHVRQRMADRHSRAARGSRFDSTEPGTLADYLHLCALPTLINASMTLCPSSEFHAAGPCKMAISHPVASTNTVVGRPSATPVVFRRSRVSVVREFEQKCCVI